MRLDANGTIIWEWATQAAERVIGVAAGAAHTFKFASLLGKTLAELAINGVTAADTAPFRFTRPVLQMADPPKSFMT